MFGLCPQAASERQLDLESEDLSEGSLVDLLEDSLVDLSEDSLVEAWAWLMALASVGLSEMEMVEEMVEVSAVEWGEEEEVGQGSD